MSKAPAIDPLFSIKVLAQTPAPQALIYAAMHQDYSEGFVGDELLNGPEPLYGEIAVKRLLAGNRGHFGVCEHPSISFAVGYFPHSVMQQARTHRIGTSFDVQCLSGDTVVTFVDVNGSSSKKLKKTMAELYDLWTNSESALRVRSIKGRNNEPPSIYRRDCKTRLRKMRVRSLNEDSNTFTGNHIEDVVFSGLNPVYKITLADGKTLKCTQNHKILTPYGWRVLGQLSVGLQVMVNGTRHKDADKTYQNKEWLSNQFEKGLRPKAIAAVVGCSAESVKKWAYHHGLDWDKSIWNTGRTYSLNISPEVSVQKAAAIRQRTKERVEAGLVASGPNHPSWKNLPPEKRVYSWMKTNRKRLLEKLGNKCSECFSKTKLHIHHVEPVKARPDLAYDESNLEVLCSSCHSSHHKKGTRHPLCAHPVEIIAIEYAGVEATYDLAMKAPNHNFVANGIVVHNSGRYSGQRIVDLADSIEELYNFVQPSELPNWVTKRTLGYEAAEKVFYCRPVGEYRDRQGARYQYTEEQRKEDLWDAMRAAGKYRDKVNQGFSEEHARGAIPFDIRQHFVVSFNARSLMHFLDLRAKQDAQLEIQQMCELMLPHFEDWMPEIAGWYCKERWGKARLAP